MKGRKKEESVHRQLIAWIWIGIIGILPFIVRLKEFALPYPLSTVFAGNNGYVTDFTLYYKGLFLNISVTILILCVLGQRWCMRRPVKVTFYREPQYRMVIAGSMCYILGVLIAFMGSAYKVLAFVGAPNSYESLIVASSYIIVFLLSIHYFQDTYYIHKVLKALTVMMCVMVGLGILEFFYQSIIEFKWIQYLILPREQWAYAGTLKDGVFDHQISMTLFNPNYAALFLLMLVPIAIYKVIMASQYKKLAYGILMMGVIMVFFFTRSTAAMYALGICMMLELIIYRKALAKVWKQVALVIGGIAILLIGIDLQMGGILYETFLGDTVQKVYEDPYPIESIQIQDYTIILEGEGERIGITGEYPLHQETLHIAGGTGHMKEDGGLTIEDKKGNRISIAIDGDVLGIDLGYAEHVWFGMDEASGFYGIGPNGTPIKDTADTSGIGFEEIQHLATGRGYIWRKAMPIFLKEGIKGTGPDTVSMYMPQNDFAGKLRYHGRVSLIIDKPHNLYLQMGINSGLIALIGFGIVIVAYSVHTLRIIMGDRYKKSEWYHFAVALFVGHIGYLVCGLAYDSNLSTAPLFWVLLGMNTVLIERIRKEVDVV